MKLPMGGYITWIAVIGTILLGIVDFYNGDTEGGLQKLAGAVALVGIGKKVEQSSPNPPM